MVIRMAFSCTCHPSINAESEQCITPHTNIFGVGQRHTITKAGDCAASTKINDKSGVMDGSTAS